MKKIFDKTKILKEAGVLLIAAVMLLSTAVAANTETNKPEPLLDTFTEGFESGTIPYGWLNVDNDSDGYLWEVVQAPEFPAHSGDYSVGSASYIDGVGELDPDDWLVLPAMKISDTTEFSYYVANQADGNEYYEIWVSTTGNNVPGDFTDMIYDGVIFNIPNFWFEFTQDLTAYNGQTIYIAFRHHGGLHTTWMKLDDITITNVTVISPIKIDVAGGIGLKATFTNTGEKEFTDIDWNITIDGGIIILPKEKSGTIETLAVGASEEVNMFVVGLGLGFLTDTPTITITATPAEGAAVEKIVEARVFLILVLGL
jgi:hypothetical protein